MRGRVVAALALALGASCAAPATADNSISGFLVLFGFGSPATVKTWDLPVRFEGTVVVSFESGFGNGRIVWSPGARGQFTVAQYRKTGRMSAFLASPDSAGASARVERGSSTCTDTGASVFDYAAVRDGRKGIEIGLAAPSFAGPGFHMTETRCGGPLLDDLGRALGMVPATRAQLVKGGFDMDFRKSAPLAVPGMTGTVTSTVVAHVGARREQRRQATARPGGANERMRQMSVRYAVEHVSGGVDATFAGGGELCGELDSCGARETMNLHLGAPLHSSFSLTALAAARRPVADLRAALGLPTRGGNPKGVHWSGEGGLTSHSTTLAAALTRDGVEACRDQRHQAAPSLDLRPVGPRLVAELSFTDLARTSCPGPALTEGPSSAAPIAVGTIARADLRKSRITLHLTRGATLESEGWSGRTKAEVTIVLRRERTTVRVYKF